MQQQSPQYQSTNSRPIVSNMDSQNHTNSRRKLQPIRVKELLHFCESDDDESEEKQQESDAESDSDELQPLPLDNDVEDVLNKSFDGITFSNDLKTSSEKSDTHGSLKPKESLPVSSVSKCELEGKTLAFHKCEYNKKVETNMKPEQLDHVQININIHAQGNIFETEHKNKHIGDIDSKKQFNEELLYKNKLQFSDQQVSCKVNNNSEPTGVRLQNFENLSQCGVNSFQNTNVKKEIVEFKSTETEDKTYNVSSTNKSVTWDPGSLVSANDQCVKQVLETPLKNALVNCTRPEPCFSRRNITQTPQNKLSDISKNHGLTPATILSHWSQNGIKQTPLQNKSITFKDSMQTPKNSAYVTASTGRHENSRYSSTDGKIRKPLMNAAGFAQNDSSNRYLLQGPQLSNVNEVTDKVQNTLSSKNINRNTRLPKKMFETSENVVHLESDNNEELENKYANIENPLIGKDLMSKVSSSKHISHCTNNSKEMLKPLCNQQQELRTITDNASNVQFSIVSNIPTPRQSRTLFVKGKEYLILGTLGHGMSGEVLRVQDLTSLELCAIKCVNLNRMDKDSAQGCLEEISMLHKLQAPCIVKMFAYEIQSPMVYVVMEMGDTDFSSLIKTMSQEKQIPLTMILYYWTEMLTAVKHIHDNGVIHSDLKPANFLLVRGRLKLIDFGIASNVNAGMTSVIKNCPIGTLNYISPEALLDIGGNSDSPTQKYTYKIGFKSDVWSLGCILYSLVYGHTPFQHIRPQSAKLHAIINPKLKIRFPVTLPSSDGNKVIPSPPILIDVMRMCLQHDPKARPTVAELLQVEYIPLKQEQISITPPVIPENTRLKIKQALSEDEWRQLTLALENRRYR